MVRGRMKHKEVIETIHQNDWEVAKENLNRWWNEKIRPNERTLITLLTLAVVLVVGYYWYGNKKAQDLRAANQSLASAKQRFDEGDMAAALSELDYIKDPRLSVPAEMINANIAYASGEYEQAISILSRLIDKAPKSLQVDLLYQYSAAQESSGDHSGALQTLEQIKSHLGDEPDTSDPSREPSLWDRYYYRQGRILAKSGKRDEAIASLRKITERSQWSLSAQNEIEWIKANPVGALPVKWANPAN